MNAPGDPDVSGTVHIIATTWSPYLVASFDGVLVPAAASQLTLSATSSSHPPSRWGMARDQLGHPHNHPRLGGTGRPEQIRRRADKGMEPHRRPASRARKKGRSRPPIATDLINGGASPRTLARMSMRSQRDLARNPHTVLCTNNFVATGRTSTCHSHRVLRRCAASIGARAEPRASRTS